MPTNLYGPGDNFDVNNSHVLAALVRKFYEAVLENKKEITLWGSGNPRREFMHADDFASAVTFITDNYNEREPINIGTGTDISIKELAEIIVKISGFKGDVKSQLRQADEFLTNFLEKRDINFSNLELRYQGAVLRTQNTGSVNEKMKMGATIEPIEESNISESQDYLEEK
jgi:GDP-L-fucose synthase